MELIPCSHVGHLFRISTYSFDGDATVIKARNNVRLVEVWMDEFKRFFYAANPSMFFINLNFKFRMCITNKSSIGTFILESKGVLPGDLSDRIALRKRLKCKSFRWYLENIYPESNFLKEYTFLGEVWFDKMLTYLVKFQVI